MSFTEEFIKSKIADELQLDLNNLWDIEILNNIYKYVQLNDEDSVLDLAVEIEKAISTAARRPERMTAMLTQVQKQQLIDTLARHRDMRVVGDNVYITVCQHGTEDDYEILLGTIAQVHNLYVLDLEDARYEDEGESDYGRPVV